jgi:SagB-type dehydrogenase family enzyme
MNTLSIILRYFTYIRINKFYSSKIERYPDINYKHYVRFPHYFLKRKFKLNNESQILLKILKQRRSKRKFKDSSITIDQLNYILTTSLGINEFKNYYRAYPSGGALYPVECYLLIHRKIGPLETGVYHYNFYLNCLELINKNVDIKTPNLIFSNNAFENSQFYIIFTGIPNRTVWKYGVKTLAFMYIEAGHMAQNIYLASATQKIGCCSLGGFIDNNIIKTLKIRKDFEYPLYALALGPLNEK